MHRGTRPLFSLLLAHICYVLFLSACTPSPELSPTLTPTPTPTPPAISLWGKIMLIAETTLSGQPQVIRQDTNTLTHLWVNAADGGAYVKQGEQPPRTLDLLANQPRDITGISGLSGLMHILWLSPDNRGANRLYAAQTNTDLSVVRETQTISDRPTYHFSTVQDQEGVIWVVWSGGQRPETNFYVQTIDASGRSRFPERLIGDADFPSLIRYADNTFALFWVRPSTNTVYRSVLQQGQIIENQNLGVKVTPENGQYIAKFQASADRTHDYLIWTLSDGATVESWYSTSVKGVNSWTEPQRITAYATGEPVETGFNSGTVFGVESGATNSASLAWADALTGEYDTVPVAGQLADALVLVYLRNGGIHGVQEIISLNAPMVEFPSLTSDHERHLYLTWSEVDLSSGTTSILFTTTRR